MRKKKRMPVQQKILSSSASTNNTPAKMMSKHDRTSAVHFKPMQITEKISTDQMGRFPKTSSNITKYAMACYVHDTNGILTEYFKRREDKELTRAFTVIYDYFVARGLTPKYKSSTTNALQQKQDCLPSCSPS